MVRPGPTALGALLPAGMAAGMIVGVCPPAVADPLLGRLARRRLRLLGLRTRRIHRPPWSSKGKRIHQCSVMNLVRLVRLHGRCVAREGQQAHTGLGFFGAGFRACAAALAALLALTRKLSTWSWHCLAALRMPATTVCPGSPH